MTKGINLILLTLILTVSLISCDSNGGSSDTGNGNVRTNYTIVSAFPLLTFDKPLGLENAGDGTNRLFVVEQKGVIHVIDNNALVNQAGSTRGVNPDATSQIFLDIQDSVLFDESELGMLGLVFHPDYESNGFFYVNYIADSPRRSVISRFTISGPRKMDSTVMTGRFDRK